MINSPDVISLRRPCHHEAVEGGVKPRNSPVDTYSIADVGASDFGAQDRMNNKI